MKNIILPICCAAALCMVPALMSGCNSDPKDGSAPGGPPDRRPAGRRDGRRILFSELGARRHVGMGKPATGQTDVRRTQAAESPGMGLPERESPRGDATENRCGGRPRPRRLHLRLVFLRRSPDAGQQIPQLGAGRRIPESSEQRPDEILAIVVQPRSGRHRPGSRDTRDVRTADRLCDRALLQASVVLARRRMPPTSRSTR